MNLMVIIIKMIEIKMSVIIIYSLGRNSTDFTVIRILHSLISNNNFDALFFPNLKCWAGLSNLGFKKTNIWGYLSNLGLSFL